MSINDVAGANTGRSAAAEEVALARDGALLVCLAVVCAPFSLLLEGYCLQSLWNWFAVPRGSPELTYLHGLLLMLAVSIYKGKFTGIAVLAPGLLFVGWIVHYQGWL